jgi:hypothetical protein
VLVGKRFAWLAVVFATFHFFFSHDLVELMVGVSSSDGLVVVIVQILMGLVVL